MQLKRYQQQALATLERYLEALQTARSHPATAGDAWDRAAWQQIGRDPLSYQPRRNGLGAIVPTICFKIPTGGGKTLLAVGAIDLINRRYRQQSTGLVLWVVPTTQIYRQTLQALRDRAHPYRQLLDMSSGGRTLILEKESRFSPDDLDTHLAVLLLMLPAANRQDKTALRLFQDQSNCAAFFPPEDQWQQHAALLTRVPNLDTFATPAFGGQRLVKSSLGNTLRLVAPLIILDEGHKAYSASAQATLFSFNPSFVLELSATPSAQSNCLVDISGQALHREGMIKLDIQLTIKSSPDWRDTLRASHAKRTELEQIAAIYAQNGGDYIRPICLIQAERTGAEQRHTPFIHAAELRAFLIERCNVPAAHIAIKSSEHDEIANHNLLDPACPIRYIITKQALQEGWDCPFAYVLAVLSNSKASTSITQLLGRILRQPYARKTGLIALDECYVYCFRAQAHQALAAVQAGLTQEGLADLVEQVQLVAMDDTSGQRRTTPRRQPFAGQVYLPWFVVADGRGGWRELRYEADVLSQVDWEQIDLHSYEQLSLDTQVSEDHSLVIGLGVTGSALRPDSNPVAPLDLVFLARQLSTVVPSPWMAYAIARNAVARLSSRYSVEQLHQHEGQLIEALKRLLCEQRDMQARAAFTAMVAADRVRCYLITGTTNCLLPSRIVGSATPPAALSLYQEQQAWMLEWYRWASGAGYAIQGQHEQASPPSVASNGSHPTVCVVAIAPQQPASPSLAQTLCRLCAASGTPQSWEQLAAACGNGQVLFQPLPRDEWERVALSLMTSP